MCYKVSRMKDLEGKSSKVRINVSREEGRREEAVVSFNSGQ